MKIWDGAVVEDDVMSAPECVIGSCVFVGKGTRMGYNVRIQHGAFIARGSSIGNNVFIGPGAKLIDDKHPRAGNTNYNAHPPVLLDGCSIGAGAIIMPGVVVGENVMIGAGAIVTKHALEGTWIGAPAISFGESDEPSDNPSKHRGPDFS